MFRKYAPGREVSPFEEPRFTDPSVPSRACCCPARPVVRVIMPPTAGRTHPVDLWLCGHHYRASVHALLAAGATVEDLTLTAEQAEAYHAAVTA
ncbi:MAG TPA: hypothetical protein VH589_10915 [Trebonia sp.]|jgi:hypothetical protein